MVMLVPNATMPTATAPDLDSRADEGVVNTEASASAPHEPASPESCPVESGDARTCSDPALPTEPQRSAATSRHSECVEDSDGTRRDSIVLVETSSRDEATMTEAIAREPLDNVSTTERATSAAVDTMVSTGETHLLSASGDCRDDTGMLGTSTDASAEDNEGNGVVRDVGAQEPVCSREGSSRKRRRTNDDVTLEPEPITPVVESVESERDNSSANGRTTDDTPPRQRECADGEERPEMSQGALPPRQITQNSRNEGQDVPQGSRSPSVPASSASQGRLSRALKVRVIARSESSVADSQSTPETDVHVLLPRIQRASTSERFRSPQGLQANAGLCSGHPSENNSSSEPTCSEDTPYSESTLQNDDDRIGTVITSTRPRREPPQSGSTGCRRSTCNSRPPEFIELETFLALWRRQHGSAHAEPNAPATAEAATAEPDQPRLVPPLPSSDAMRDDSSTLRGQPALAAADDDDVIAESCKLSRGIRHWEDNVASGRRLCHCRRAVATASQARATARDPQDGTAGEAVTATNFLSGARARALRRAALFEMNSMRALHVLQLCRDERTRRVVLQLYNEGRNSLAMEAYAAEIHALVRSAVDRASLDGSALAGFLQDLTNAEWLLPDTPRRSAGGPQLRNMRDQL
ncbi:hypothetical protein MTO96_038006 [Rhipicephalus appendiculatus]